MKLVLIGRNGLQTSKTLLSLVKSSIIPSLVLVENKDSELPPLTELICKEEKINFSRIDSLLEYRQEIISSDINIVSSYGKKITAQELGLGDLFNLHPSILPEYKGPSPIFWALKEGNKKFGASIHKITENFDEGEVVASSRFEFNNSFSTDIVSKIYEFSGDLLVQWIKGESKIVDSSKINPSYFSFPGEEDFIIDLGWRIEHIITFVNSIKFYGNPKLELPNGEIRNIDSVQLLSSSQYSRNSELNVIDARNAVITRDDGILLLRLNRQA